MRHRAIITLLTVWFLALTAGAQISISGQVTDYDTGSPIEFASVLLSESGLWAITNGEGTFTIRNVPEGRHTMTVQCLGYQKLTLPMILKRNVNDLRLKLRQENLRLKEVTVTAKRKQNEATTSYTIDRQTLDNQQILNISDIAALLPGGKTVNPTLMNDSRLALRSGQQEKGNASFGTAIEIDGMRLDNNAMTDETMGASTRTLSASNVESVEIVTGIPSVEYGDLSNGVVKINTRRGKSPFIVEGKINQHTRQLAVNKGFDLGGRRGVLNASAEHARSFSNAVSPHTAYQRNVLSLSYMNIFLQESTPLTLNIGMTGNLGGYNSKADPDELLDNYTKSHDNALRANMELNWLLNKRWITNVQLNASLAYSDRRSESYTNDNSAATRSYIHTTQEGYYMAEDYDVNPTAPIVLSPTGYWYVRSFNDSKPLSWAVKMKADWTRRFGKVANRATVGLQYTGSRNNGRGLYYEDMRYAPTWREYRYDELPTMHNLGIYVEDKLVVPTSRLSTFELTAGLREDLTMIGGSDYGNVSSLSPRANARYVFWKNRRTRLVRSLELHAGWGKSVKQPSFQVLYPSPSYTDLLAFASTSDATNKSYRSYYTLPTQARYNPNLRWQYTQQTDIGIEADIAGNRISLSGFYHRTNRAYMSQNVYTPFTYQFTSVDSLNSLATRLAAAGINIPVDDRRFSIDPQSGQVTMRDAAGTIAPQPIGNRSRNTYAVNTTYVNSEQPIHRYGLEWIVDFAQIKPILTTIRLDGAYTIYKGTDELLYPDIPTGVNTLMANKELYQYVGYYRGSKSTSAGSVADAGSSIANGSLSRQLNLNATFTTHIPKIRMIVSLRLESSLYRYQRPLSQLSTGPRGYMMDESSAFTGEPYDGTTTDKYIAVYPEYYATWDNPTELIPFAERFLWAKDNDPLLYSDLAKLVVRSNYPYSMNPDRLSAYYSANLSVTKEIGDHVSVSFYANNFFRNMRMVHSTQTNLDTSLFSSSYIPSFYYGLSLRLKL